MLLMTQFCTCLLVFPLTWSSKRKIWSCLMFLSLCLDYYSSNTACLPCRVSFPRNTESENTLCSRRAQESRKSFVLLGCIQNSSLDKFSGVGCTGDSVIHSVSEIFLLSPSSLAMLLVSEEPSAMPPWMHTKTGWVFWSYKELPGR